MSNHTTILADDGHAHQFEDLPQQKEADSLGMWLFLATEVMLFGAIFAAYIIYRRAYYQDFADGSNEIDLRLGTLNTVILLTSSFFVVLAVRAARLGKNRAIAGWLIMTIVLGVAFLCVKGVEYTTDYKEGLVPFFGWWGRTGSPRNPQVELFFFFYFVMTGIHAIHIIAGLIAVALVARMAARGKFSAAHHMHVEIVGLYWHFIDIVWVFLLPTLYMVSPHQWKGL